MPAQRLAHLARSARAAILRNSRHALVAIGSDLTIWAAMRSSLRHVQRGFEQRVRVREPARDADIVVNRMPHDRMRELEPFGRFQNAELRPADRRRAPPRPLRDPPAARHRRHSPHRRAPQSHVPASSLPPALPKVVTTPRERPRQGRCDARAPLRWRRQESAALSPPAGVSAKRTDCLPVAP